MTTGYVVIGAGYGDEGKGLMTDYLVRKHKAGYVVRFNGGAQAGHTVQTPEGDRHVFGHVGAGTFAGVQTVLGPKFIINPLILQKEAKALGEKFIKPIPFASSPISTVYDMILNAAVENARGVSRHGSCGVGINETVTRHQSHPLALSNLSRDMFRRIRYEYFPKRWEELGKPELTSDMQLVLDIDPSAHFDSMRRSIELYMSAAPITEQPGFSLLCDTVVFEGAQGLELDEELGMFPFVTRSLTGLPQAIHAAAQLGVKKLIPVYVTRCYKTRHGAGPFQYEGRKFAESFKDTDTTNVPNQFQGTIRKAPLYIASMRELIQADLKRSTTFSTMFGVDIMPAELAITCIDQVQTPEGKYNLSFYDLHGQHRTLDVMTPEYLTMELAAHLRMYPKYYSTGPTHRDVSDYMAS